MTFRSLVGGLACLLAAACAYVDATTTQYVGVPRFAPTEPKSVEVLSAEPMRPHERLGETLLDISVEPAPPVEEIEQKLREEAARLGGHAVFVVRDQVHPTAGRKLIAVTIRYR